MHRHVDGERREAAHHRLGAFPEIGDSEDVQQSGAEDDRAPFVPNTGRTRGGRAACQASTSARTVSTPIKGTSTCACSTASGRSPNESRPQSIDDNCPRDGSGLTTTPTREARGSRQADSIASVLRTTTTSGHTLRPQACRAGA